MAAVDFTGTWIEVKKEGFDAVLEAMSKCYFLLSVLGDKDVNMYT